MQEFFTIPVNGRVLNAYVLKPPTFSLSRRHPVLFFQYSGPYSQQVTQAFSLAFNEYVSGELGICVIVVDGVGTGARGIQVRPRSAAPHSLTAY
jgi:dipeptidyl aminopeptidase/acylaminoacyl peptidase